MNHAANHTHTKGFTLIELMLAMTFISVLLLGIAMTIIQIANIYNKGTTVKDLNQSSRLISNDIMRTAADAQSFNEATDLQVNSGGGRLCIGKFSYIWNTAAAIDRNDALLNKFESDPGKRINLVKVPDTAKIYCSLNSEGNLTYSAIRAMDTINAQELLPAGDHTLAINKLEIPEDSVVVDDSTKQTLYTLTYVLGSGNISAMNEDQTACLDPSFANSDLTYCSVQQFTIVLRAGNKVN